MQAIQRNAQYGCHMPATLLARALEEKLFIIGLFEQATGLRAIPGGELRPQANPIEPIAPGTAEITECPALIEVTQGCLNP